MVTAADIPMLSKRSKAPGKAASTEPGTVHRALAERALRLRRSLGGGRRQSFLDERFSALGAQQHCYEISDSRRASIAMPQ